MKIKKKKSINKKDVNVVNSRTGETWYYSDTVKDHFFHPQNILLKDPKANEYDADGMVGSPACGDMMRMWIKVYPVKSAKGGAKQFNRVDPKTERVKKLKWRTFGCASAIAATSMFSVMVTEKGGMKISDALKIKPQDIIKRLSGLPDRKIHCSVLADKAFQKTVNNYFRKTRQYDRIITDGAKIVDERLNITDKDIEEAVLEGARDLEGVQRKLKVGVGMSPASKAGIEQLIRFYSEKYYG